MQHPSHPSHPGSSVELAARSEEGRAYQDFDSPIDFVVNPPLLVPVDFLVSPGNVPTPNLSPARSSLLTPPASPSNREPVRILVVGTAYGIDNIVHTLYVKGFAHISEWSGLLPHSSGKLMRILTRYVPRNEDMH